MKPPGNRNHLDQLLTRSADVEQFATAGRLRRVVGSVVVARMLNGLPDADGNNLVVFKGGTALEMRFGLRAPGVNQCR